MFQRTTRSGASAQDVLVQLTHRERLLVAQVIYEIGSDKWSEASKLLGQHPLIPRTKRNFFTPSACQGMYVSMMKDIGIELKDSLAEEVKLPKAKVNLKLAQVCYEERVNEIKEAILQEETKFQALASEIQAIQEGKMDERILAELQEAISKSSKVKSTASPPTRRTRHGKSVSLDVPATPTPQKEEPGSDTQEGSVKSPTAPLTDPVQVLHRNEDSPVRALSLQASSHKETSPAQEDTASKDHSEENEPGADVGEGEAMSTAQEDASSNPGTPVEEEHEDAQESKPGTRRQDRRRPTVTRSGKLKGPDSNTSDGSKDRKRTRDVSEATKEEEATTSAPKRPKTTSQSASSSKRFQSIITMLLTTIFQHRNGNVFQNPIKESDAPDYFEIVKRPMDLKTVKTKIKDGQIGDSSDFERDIYLIYANAMMYNQPGSEIYKMAEEMMLESEHHIQTHRQTEGFRAR